VLAYVRPPVRVVGLGLGCAAGCARDGVRCVRREAPRGRAARRLGANIWRGAAECGGLAVAVFQEEERLLLS